MSAPYRVSFLIEGTGHRGTGPLTEQDVREGVDGMVSPYAKISEITINGRSSTPAEDIDNRDWEALTEMNASLVDANARLTAAAADMKSLVGRFLAGQLDAAKPSLKKSVTVLLNGRRRGQVMLASTASEAEAREEVSEPQYDLHDCREPGKNGVRKFLYVPGKVINIILDESPKTPEEWAEGWIDATINEITESEAFCSAMAETNAVAYYIDEHEVTAVRPPLTNHVWILTVRYGAQGEQSEDHPMCGDRIRGTAQALVHFDGSVVYREVTAEVERESVEE
jgi:hypothetical protein